MKRSIKLLALIMALVMLLGTVAGCKTPDSTETQTVTMNDADSEATAAPEVTPEPTPDLTVNQAAADALDALDLKVFCWYATMDGYSYHMFVNDPTQFGIDPSTVTMTLGEFTEEDSKRLGLEAGVFLEELKQINREQLPEEQQFSYDVLEQILIDFSEETNYEYYYEPLTEYSGIHANLPLSFALFELKDTQDVDDYLMLLADVPRYMGQVLAYEQKRAELDMFMTEDALTAILDDCQTIIDSRDTSFLYATFNEAIDELNLPADQAQTYKDRNTSLIQNEFIGAYETLYNGLVALKGSCRTYEQAATLTENQKNYFEYSMQSDANNFMSVEETLEMLKDEFNYLLNDYITIYSDHPDLDDLDSNTVPAVTAEENLDSLKSIMSQLLPALPEHNLTLTDVPEELQDMFSPAAYVIPALDDWKDNIVYINTAETDDESDIPEGQETYYSAVNMLSTLAHECYPGHLYQYVYQRSIDSISRMQKVSNFGGYAEGWAQFAEYLVAQNQTKYDKNYYIAQFDYNMMFNALLPAIISILVDYYGYTQDALSAYLTGIGLEGEYVAGIYYPLVVDQPYYFFEYAIGYAQLAQMYRDIKSDLGDNFDQEGFLQTYMDLGPGYFEMIKEKMDVWADSVMNDEAA
ncbi:MAG: DUF885 family protein [Clostridiaceae bacterium]